MALLKGDEIVTKTDGIGVLVLAGYQVIMDPGTDLTIENPSIFVRIGRIIVKKLEEVREALTVRTELGAAAVEGTEFVFEVTAQQEVRITVLEGRVRVTPSEAVGSRDPVTLAGGERGRLDTRRARRLPPLSRRGIDSVRRRITDVEVIIRPRVPDLRGLSEEQARAELGRLGLRATVVGVVTRQAQPDLRRRAAVSAGPRPGMVVSTSPPAGAGIRQGATVQLSVEEPSGPVPNVMGQPFDSAKQMLEAAGLLVGDTTSNVQPNGQDGTISGMAPIPGTIVRPGTRVSLTILRVRGVDDGRVIDRGVIDRRGIEVLMCRVPNLIGMTVDQAKAALETARLKPGEIHFGAGDAVTSQSMEAGATLQCGSPVSFVIGSVIR